MSGALTNGELIPQAREIAREAAAQGKEEQARVMSVLIDGILDRLEHAWFEEGAEEVG